jgi:hypothetical protein
MEELYNAEKRAASIAVAALLAGLSTNTVFATQWEAQC